MYIYVIAMGRLSADPEMKATEDLARLATFDLAVRRSYGENKTDFFKVVAWRNQAEFVAKHLKKGNMVLVDGKLETHGYVDKRGVSRRVCEIVARNIHFADGRIKTPGTETSQSPEEVEYVLRENALLGSGPWV
jgi:single-strand DNA-binding protein